MSNCVAMSELSCEMAVLVLEAAESSCAATCWLRSLVALASAEADAEEAVEICVDS